MHQTQVSGFRKAIQIGVDSMEHAPLDALSDEDVGRMVDSKIPIVPTIKVWRDELLLDRITDLIENKGSDYLCPEPLRQTRAIMNIFQKGITPEMAKKEYFPNLALIERQLPVMMENVARLHQKGAAIGCGTDSGGTLFSFFGKFFEEIENLIAMGFSTFEALQSATLVNARILGLDDKLGTIEPGKLADFVVLDGDPLADIRALRAVHMVVKEGETAYKKREG
jgi:imidazolonepropionase-like amidohydrolase